jgi:uncharacterized protein
LATEKAQIEVVMAHERPRFIQKLLGEYQSFWPVIGIVGPRQVGKTTILRNQIKYESYVTLDEEDFRNSARMSAKVFLSQFESPLVIDEITKAPDLFDAIKAKVDKKRIPGQFIISGSSQFSEKLGIRESLTGRIGIVKLNPLCLSEATTKDPMPLTLGLPIEKPRFGLEEILHHAQKGGMPVPMFTREELHVEQYWKSWLDTTIYRDTARFFKRGFDPEFAFEIVHGIAQAMSNGELATLSNIKIKNARKANVYLSALEDVFLLKRTRCHQEGVGKDCWMFFDGGFTNFMMNFSGFKTTESALTLIRHFLFNETSVKLELMKKRDDRTYYKSAKGSPVDWVWDNVPYKIIQSTKSIGWEEKALIGSMKKLGSKVGYLVAPVDFATKPKAKGGIGILPWGTWS